MTFSCRNYDFNQENCKKLHSDCIPGRPGCVLEGRVTLSEALEEKLRALEEERASRLEEKKRK